MAPYVIHDFHGVMQQFIGGMLEFADNNNVIATGPKLRFHYVTLTKI